MRPLYDWTQFLNRVQDDKLSILSSEHGGETRFFINDLKKERAGAVKKSVRHDDAGGYGVPAGAGIGGLYTCTTRCVKVGTRV